MERLTFEIEDDEKRRFLSQLALRGKSYTVKRVLTDAVRHWFQLVSAARNAVKMDGEEDNLRALKDVLQEIDSA